ncbi:Scr1 family TA system antitoxin-like transcriptional regulator [Longispora urticae]
MTLSSTAWGMTPGRPEGDRFELLLFLRTPRETAGHTQQTAAERLGWSLSKLHRIETAFNGISTTDLEALLRLYTVPAGQWRYWQALRAAAQRPRGGWARAGELLVGVMRQVVAAEQAATWIRAWNPGAVPDLLRTDEYAECLASEPVGRHLVVLDLRRRAVFGRSVRLEFLLGEEALTRAAATGGGQLEHLRAVAAAGQASIRWLPLALGMHPGLAGPVTVYTTPPNELIGLHLPDPVGGLVDDTPSEVARFADLFEHLHGRSQPLEKFTSTPPHRRTGASTR